MKLTIIREATEKDIDDILHLLSQVKIIHRNGRPDIFSSLETKYTKDELKEIISNESTPIFVSCIDNKVIGYAFCQIKEYNDKNFNNIKTLYIDDFCVDSQYRRQNIGKKIYDYVYNFASEKGCYNITLNVWSFNENATRFYESVGMKPQRTIMEDIIKK